MKGVRKDSAEAQREREAWHSQEGWKAAAWVPGFRTREEYEIPTQHLA